LDAPEPDVVTLHAIISHQQIVESLTCYLGFFKKSAGVCEHERGADHLPVSVVLPLPLPLISVLGYDGVHMMGRAFTSRRHHVFARFPEPSVEGPEPDAGLAASSAIEKPARRSKLARLGCSSGWQGNDRATAGRIVPLGRDRQCCQEGRRPGYRVAGQLREARRTATTCQNSKGQRRQ
jgi:hypothetical protein